MRYIARLPDVRSGRGAAGFARQHGSLFSVTALPGARIAQNARGHFISAQSFLHRRNIILARQLQDLMVERLEESLVRPGVSSGRLEAALLDERNRVATAFGFGVGRRSWLDRSQAKYWRQIESGTRMHVGRALPMGVWGGSLTGGMMGGGRYGPYPEAGQPFTATGGATGGRIRPMGRTYAYRALRAAGLSARAAYQAAQRPGIIKEPITAHHYMRDAWRAFNPHARAISALREAVNMTITP